MIATLIIPAFMKLAELPIEIWVAISGISSVIGDEIIIQADLAKKLNIHPSSLMEMRKQNRLPQGIVALTS
jgi:folate-dependent phosphoribosylglycinamide formyltransferase PurN